MRTKLKQRAWILAFLTATVIAVFRGRILLSQLTYIDSAQLALTERRMVSAAQLTRTRRHIFSELRNVTEDHYKHVVNVHFWDHNCGHEVEALRSHPLFPFLPFRRQLIDKLELNHIGLRFGARIFGFLHPQVSGNYKFALSSDDGSELWLSTDYDPMNVRMLAEVGGPDGKKWTYRNQFNKYPSQKSNDVQLLAGKKYFFEVLWKQDRGRGHMQVVWKPPQKNKFISIGREHLSKYYDDSFMDDGLVYEYHLKVDPSSPDLPSHVNRLTKQRRKERQERTTPYQRDSPEFLSLPVLDFNRISTVLTTCDYYPSYIIDREKAEKLKLYEGVHLPHYYNSSTQVWPHDKTWEHCKECYGGPGDHLIPLHCVGNYKLSKSSALWVANSYMRALERRFPKRYNLHTVVNVEKGNDDTNGHRYLLELAVKDTKKEKIYRLSVYVFNPNGTKKICYPKDFQWNPSAMVYLTLTTKNQGPWVYQYIMSLANIYQKTNDSRFSLIVVDFDSYDIDLERILQLSGLPHYKIIKKSGKFHKTIAIQDAADTIHDKNSIVLQTDLHLEFPLHFIDDTRKHSVQGKMGYTPLLLRLACGRFPYSAAGFWEFLGYGVFGLYKSDWDVVGGMNVEKFRNSWGGEDWEFGDRVMKHGYEIERLKLPYFFHYFHTKKGMWDGKAS